MTDQEHADAIQSAVSALNLAIGKAREANIATEIDVYSLSDISRDADLHLVSVTVSKRLYQDKSKRT